MAAYGIPSGDETPPPAQNPPRTASPARESSPDPSEMDPLLGFLGPHPHQHSGHHSHFHMDLNPTVYTCVLYTPAVSRIKHGHACSRATRVATLLVFVNMCLQVGILRIMDIYGNRDAQMSVAGLIKEQEADQMEKVNAEMYKAFLTPQEKEIATQADKVPSLCNHFTNGTYACSPPSVHYIKFWHQLDVDGDGVWTMAEALSAEQHMAMETDVGKRMLTELHTLGIHHWIFKRPTLVFNNIVNGLKLREDYVEKEGSTLFLSDDVKQRRAIAKSYFNYWVGDAMLCTRYESVSCDSVVASGLFDSALTHGRLAAAHKGIVDYDSALRYCRMMLEGGGGCDQSLPVSFKENRLNRAQMCGTVSLTGGVDTMTNPSNTAEILPVLKPKFSNLEKEKQASHAMFLLFKGLLMYLFYSSVVEEFADLMKLSEFLFRFPGLSHRDDRGGVELKEDEQGEDGKQFRITGISRFHRIFIGAVFALRIFILLVLLKFGSWFLLTESRYIELVMNALALSFITGIDEVIFSTFMNSSELDGKSHGLDDVEPIVHPSIIPHSSTPLGYVFKQEFWGLFIIPFVSFVMVFWNAYITRAPIIEALTCTCEQQGNNCAESMVHQRDWWNHYWAHILPAAIHQIEAMRTASM